MADDKESLLDDVNEAFRKFDSNQDGFLTAHDVKMMFELMDFRLNSKDFKEFFACGDTSGTGKINLQGLIRPKILRVGSGSLSCNHRRFVFFFCRFSENDVRFNSQSRFFARSAN